MKTGPLRTIGFEITTLHEPQGGPFEVQLRIEETGMDLKVFVATHKSYPFPVESCYQPIHVGRKMAQHDLGILGDDSGDNISSLNPTYCELTGLYWAWRNTSHDTYGLAHYRRYFRSESGGVATSAEMQNWLRQADVVVARPRRYYVETVRQQYSHAHNESDLETVHRVVNEFSPDYQPAFNTAMARRSLSLYNMFLMPNPIFDSYCSWLFSVLAEASRRIPWDTYGAQQRRVIGYLGERLLNVWIVHHRGLRVMHRPVFQTEPEHLGTKAIRFVGRSMGLGKLD